MWETLCPPPVPSPPLLSHPWELSHIQREGGIWEASWMIVRGTTLLAQTPWENQVPCVYKVCWVDSHTTRGQYLFIELGQNLRLKELLRGSGEKAMAPHSSTLAWEIPWMQEPSRLQSMGSLRVRHDWATSLSLFTFMHWRRKWQPTPLFLPEESQGRGSCQ